MDARPRRICSNASRRPAATSTHEFQPVDTLRFLLRLSPP